jgi:hypothetical protein
VKKPGRPATAQFDSGHTAIATITAMPAPDTQQTALTRKMIVVAMHALPNSLGLRRSAQRKARGFLYAPVFVHWWQNSHTSLQNAAIARRPPFAGLFSLMPTLHQLRQCRADLLDRAFDRRALRRAHSGGGFAAREGTAGYEGPVVADDPVARRPRSGPPRWAPAGNLGRVRRRGHPGRSRGPRGR